VAIDPRTLFQRFLGILSPSKGRRLVRRTANLRGGESLESRAMLSATYDDGSGVLTLQGTERGDVISVSKGHEAGSVVVRGVDGVKRDAVFFRVSAVSIEALGGNDRVVIGRGIRNASGGLMSFTIDGGNGNDAVDAGDGDDTLRGGEGNDQIRGRGGNDRIEGGGGNDVEYGEAGNDDLSGGPGIDSLAGGLGSDMISGGDGNDVASGDDGDDMIHGDAGRDTLNGGNGRDSIEGGTDADSVNGGGDDDVLRGDDGTDTIHGNAGNDSISGGADDDSLYGDDGDDDLNGDGGKDRIRGGRGADESLDDDSIADVDAGDRRGRGSNSGSGSGSGGSGGGSGSTSGSAVVFSGGVASVSGASATRNDKQFFTFVAPAGATLLRVELLADSNGKYADLEIEETGTSRTVVELEPSDTGVHVADGLAIVAGRNYSVRLRAPKLDPVGFTLNLAVS
jgi:Ca2+-binding RTX toxin-like protein